MKDWARGGGAGGAGSVPHKGRMGAGRCVLPRDWGGAQVKGVSWKVGLTPPLVL